MTTRWLLLIPLLVLTSACGTFSRSGGYYQDDGPGSNPPPDVASLPDAVPREEPRSQSGNNPYTVAGVTYYPLARSDGYHERGIASWYGRKFHGKRTSSGEPYDMYSMTAAHKTLPLPSYVRVRNLQNGRSIVVRVNDRGPFLSNRLIDLSYAGAAKLGIIGTGTGIVDVEAVTPGEPPVQVAGQQSPPLQLVSTAAAADSPPKAAAPKLYLQVGAFTRRDNAIQLRDRLEREALRPIIIQCVLGSVAAPSLAQCSTQAPAGANAVEAARIYRVRVGPFATVEEGDRLTQRAARLGVANALIVVE